MRKFERAGGVIGLLMVIISVLFGFNINTYVLLRVFLIVMSIYYLWFGFFLFNRIGFIGLLNKEVRQKINTFKTGAGIIMGVVYSFCLIAIMFGVYLYANKVIILAIAVIALVSSTFFIAVYNTLNMPLQRFYNQFYRRSLIIGAVLFSTWLIPVEKRLDILYKNYPDFIKAYNEYRSNPEDTHALEALREARTVFK